MIVISSARCLKTISKRPGRPVSLTTLMTPPASQRPRGKYMRIQQARRLFTAIIHAFGPDTICRASKRRFPIQREFRTSAIGALLLLVGFCPGLATAGPSISIRPNPVIVSPGQSIQLETHIIGPSQYRVKWILQGPLIGEVDAGSLSADGLYQAPGRRPHGPVRIVVQVSTGEWNLPVAAASVAVRFVPEGMPAPTFSLPPPPPEPPGSPEFPAPPEFPEFPAPPEPPRS